MLTRRTCARLCGGSCAVWVRQRGFASTGSPPAGGSAGSSGSSQEVGQRTRDRQREPDWQEEARAIHAAIGPPTTDERQAAIETALSPRRRAALTCGWCKQRTDRTEDAGTHPEVVLRRLSAARLGTDPGRTIGSGSGQSGRACSPCRGVHGQTVDAAPRRLRVAPPSTRRPDQQRSDARPRHTCRGPSIGGGVACR